jgi:glycosyltransferase involved in cell wall biosynthesis
LKPHLVVVNNLPAFYRTPAFAALQTAWFQQTSGRFTVLYQSRRDPARREENFFTPDDQLPYAHMFLSRECDTSDGASRYRAAFGVRMWVGVRPTHILTAGWDTPASIASQVYGRVTGARLCLWSESTAQTSAHAGLLPGMYRRWAASGADSYLFPTKAAKAWLEAISGRSLEPSLVLPNPVRGDRLPDDNISDPRFVFLGDLSRRKGFDLVCEVMRRHTGWSSVAYGRDPESLSALAPSNVLWHGSHPFSAILPTLRASDVLVIPSRSDPAPLTFSEGLVLGLRIVVSPEIAYGAEYGGQDGICVPTELTVAGLAGAMAMALAMQRPSSDLARSANAGQWAKEVVQQCLP